EDADGFEDADGCPEEDNDRDGFTDAQDRCPLEAEVINGVDDEDGCPDAGEPTVRLEGGRIVTRERLGFAGQSDRLAPKSAAAVQQVALLLRARRELSLTVEVHTDEPASAEANQKLSQARADNVKAALVSAGVDAARIEARGLGNTQPADTGKTPAAKEANRRVELIVSQGGSR
ncbi:MAG: OmpA family protein, partial [Myxococcales bacterium]